MKILVGPHFKANLLHDSKTQLTVIVGVLVLQQRGGRGLDLRDEGALLGRHGLLGGRGPARRRLPVRPQPGGRDVRLIAPEKTI